MSDLFGKAKDALNSDQGEKVSDTALDKGADAAGNLGGGGHEDAVRKAREEADQRVGNE